MDQVQLQQPPGFPAGSHDRFAAEAFDGLHQLAPIGRHLSHAMCEGTIDHTQDAFTTVDQRKQGRFFGEDVAAAFLRGIGGYAGSMRNSAN